LSVEWDGFRHTFMPAAMKKKAHSIQSALAPFALALFLGLRALQAQRIDPERAV
jgi:hypothetical protein